MSRQGDADAADKSLASFLGMVVMIAVLMTVFVYYYLKHEDNYLDVALNTAVSTFSSHVIAIHGQWEMLNRPTKVHSTIDMDGKQIQIVEVNKFGWPEANASNVPCAAIWQQVMAHPLKILNYPVSVIEIKSQQENGAFAGKICRYFLSDAIYFEYNSANGKVTKAN